MNKFRRMDPGAGDGAGGSNNNPDSVTLDRLHAEIRKSNEQMLVQLQESNAESLKTIVAEVTKAKEEIDSGDRTSGANRLSAAVNDFQEELGAMGIEDEGQAQALLGLIDKVIAKKAPAFKKDILTSVDSKDDFKTKRQEYNNETSSHYPDILDKGSTLFAATQQIWTKELTEAQRNSPDGPAIATMRAAQRLGIAPLTRQQIIQCQSENPTGSGLSSQDSLSNTEREGAIDLATTVFKIDRAVFEKRLNQKSVGR